MDADLCREHLSKLLTEESAALQRLEALLDREHESLRANDFASFERTSKEREACVGELVCLEDERHTLCRTMNVSCDRRGLEQLMTECDDSGALLVEWNQCIERAAHCRTLNDRNGSLVNTRLGHVQSLLDIVTDRAGRPKTYGRQGTFHGQQPSARVLASA